MMTISSFLSRFDRLSAALAWWHVVAGVFVFSAVLAFFAVLSPFSFFARMTFGPYGLIMNFQILVLAAAAYAAVSPVYRTRRLSGVNVGLFAVTLFMIADALHWGVDQTIVSPYAADRVPSSLRDALVMAYRGLPDQAGVGDLVIVAGARLVLLLGVIYAIVCAWMGGGQRIKAWFRGLKREFLILGGVFAGAGLATFLLPPPSFWGAVFAVTAAIAWLFIVLDQRVDSQNPDLSENY